VTFAFIFPRHNTFEAYNSNLLFNDLNRLEPHKIDIEDDDEVAFYLNAIEERKTYLHKNDIKDICQYLDCPSSQSDEDVFNNSIEVAL
jgi:hypothetical protein